MGFFPQSNGWVDSQPEFFRMRRPQPQAELAISSGKLTSADARTFDKMLWKLTQLIPVTEKPALIYGDLWSGNVVEGPDGDIWMIEPAVAYSGREADLAMTRLFGGFPQEFYESYSEAFPLLPGWEERVPLWNLYPLLVHVNLLGQSYLQAVREAPGRFT